MYITRCEIDDQSNLMCETEHSKPVHGDKQRDGKGREVGGAFGMRDTCTPVADSRQCMANLPQNSKVISLQLK